MPPPRIQRTVAKPVPKVREGNDASYASLIRQLPCVISGEAAEGHHLLRTGEHGMGLKSTDKWLIPLAARFHRGLHDDGNEEAFLMRYGIDGRALASALYACRNDPEPLESMRRVVFRFHQESLRKREVAV